MLRRYDLSCAVDPYRDGWTLAGFLEHRFRYYPSEVWAARLAEGAVTVNGDVAGAERVVHRGDRIQYVLWHEEPDVDFTHTVLHEDEHVLAVAKSGNLPVHAGGNYIRNTLIAELRETRDAELRLAHRLDRETSGVVLLAKTREAARFLEREFHARRVQKEYLALVHGSAPDAFDVDAPIALGASASGLPMRVVDRERGKPALTRFVRLAVRSVGEPVAEISMVLARPESGRTNQIRVHALHAGHPIVGDKIYGGSHAAPSAPRHLLHCRRLAVRHPVGDGRLDLTAPAPPDFAAAWGAPLPPFAVSWA
jgi:RluA family pseudouridine synthase